MPCIGRVIRKGVLAGTIAASLAMVAPGVASAKCPSFITAFSGQMSHTYAHLGDFRKYYLLMGGSFDPGTDNFFAPWILGRGAERVKNGDTTRVGDSSHSLRMYEGAEVQSAWFCIDQDHPYFRFSAKFRTSSGRQPTAAKLNVRIVASGGLWGRTTYTPWVTLKGNEFMGWAITDKVTLTKDVDLGPGGWRIGRIIFKAEHGGWNIDSVNIDPYMRR